MARIIDRYLGTPTQLYEKLGIKGVLSLQEIGSQEQQRQAIEFDYLTPFRQVVGLKDLVNKSVLKGHPQTMHSLSLDSYKTAVELGGVYAG